jgi:hypothetical protein
MTGEIAAVLMKDEKFKKFGKLREDLLKWLVRW